MYSSRMRTAHLLTIWGGGGLSNPEGGLHSGGICPTRGGVCPTQGGLHLGGLPNLGGGSAQPAGSAQP